MFGDLQRMQKNLHDFFEYSNSMASLWTKYFEVSLEKANESAQILMELVENQLQPNPDALTESLEYADDFLQRQILFWDVLRKRGNQYLKHEQEGQPPVLIFPYKILMDGRTLEHPVNYALAEIFHPSRREVDSSLRPYVIVDPRAGHGAGISGFKDKSQVGIALEAGHPSLCCHFLPQSRTKTKPYWMSPLLMNFSSEKSLYAIRIVLNLVLSVTARVAGPLYPWLLRILMLPVSPSLMVRHFLIGAAPMAKIRCVILEAF
jgi:hypothetical protein